MNWTIFATVFTYVDAPMAAAVNGLAAALSGYVGPVLKAALALYVFVSLLWSGLSGDQRAVSKAEEIIIGGAFALAFASEMAVYTPYVRNLAVNGLSREIGNLMTGAVGNRPVSGALFDEVWNKAYLAGVAVYRNLPWSVAGLGLCAVVVLYWIVAVFAIAFGFLVWLKAYVFLSVLIGVGPLFVGLFIFPWTRGWFFGWLNTTAASLVLQILTVALVTLLIGAQTRILLILSNEVANRGNEIVQLQMLFGGMVLFVTCGWLALQLPGAAASITHGFAGFGHMAVSLPNFGGGKGAGRGTGPGSGAAGSGSGMAPVTRNTPPAGSLAG